MEGLTGRIVAPLAAVCGVAVIAVGQAAGQPSPQPAATTPPEPEALARVAQTHWINWAIVGAAILLLATLYRFDVIRPGSFRRGQRRDVSNLPAAYWFMGAIMVFCAQVAGMIAASGALTFFQKLSDRATVFQIVAGYLAATATAIVVIRMTTGGHHKDGLTLRARDAALGLAWLVPTLLVTAAVSILAVQIVTLVDGPPDQIAHEGLRKMLENRDSPWTRAMLAAAIIGAPIVEEVMYRGFLQSAVVRLLGGRIWIAITVSSLIFSAAHATQVPLHGLVTLFVLGVCLGFSFEKTRGLAAPIVIHMGFNAVNALLAFAS